MDNVFQFSTADWVYVFLFLISIIAGVVDAIAGGGGLITVPSLLLVGLPPMTVLGTNRLQAVIGELTTSVMFMRNKQFPVQGIVLGFGFSSVLVLSVCLKQPCDACLTKTVPHYTRVW